MRQTTLAVRNGKAVLEPHSVSSFSERRASHPWLLVLDSYKTI